MSLKQTRNALKCSFLSLLNAHDFSVFNFLFSFIDSRQGFLSLTKGQTQGKQIEKVFPWTIVSVSCFFLQTTNLICTVVIRFKEEVSVASSFLLLTKTVKNKKKKVVHRLLILAFSVNSLFISASVTH